ncbi:MAG: PEP-CTERM/exosortase system-associated acyltransferase [Alphaproteobacteria bacterium]|nr:PEP-CTERM/exosortase system-associated acyltransferase [Alphaproteobacteria bacterium]MBU0858334.1 PEP-CTERM/exosortase system-associated acyltransferase [Alphaproteobacteria bacterium]
MRKKSWISACVQSIQQQAFYNTYWNTFSVQPADTPKLRAQAYRLRYDVFCRENGFIDPAQHTDEYEHDEFDERATHHVMIHKQSGQVAGTVRVLLPDPDRPLTSFEMQKVCDHPLLQIENRALGLAEISRLCMAREFRRRPRDGHILPSYYEQEWNDGQDRPAAMPFFRRRIPYAPLGLMMAAYQTVLGAGLLDAVSAVDPGQFRSLKRIGMSYRVLGPRINHQGSQQPFIFNIKTALDTMAVENPECWDVVSDRGRLHRRANELSQNHWHDEIFDEVCKEMILRKLI